METAMPAVDREAAIAAQEAAMRADGVPTETPVQEEYFGFDETHKFFFPDGITFIEHKTLNHGDRKKYLNKVNRDVVLQRATGDARISMKPGDEKDELVKSAIVNWNLIRNGQPLPFSMNNFEQWLSKANPKLVDELERDIRRHNPWLMADMSVEDIDREIEALQEMRENKLKEEAGKDS